MAEFALSAADPHDRGDDGGTPPPERAADLEAALGRIAVLIVNFNAGDWLRHGLERLTAGPGHVLEIVIVDNGSDDGSLDGLDGPHRTIDRAGANLGFGPGMNRAAGRTDRELLLMLNPDAELAPEAVARLVAELDTHPDAVLVAGRVVDADGREQRGSRRQAPTAGRILRELLPGGRGRGIDLTATPEPDRSIPVEAVSGACMLVRADAFHAVGGFDEGYPLHFEDLDLFARLRDAGGTIRWVPGVTVRHQGGVSSRGHDLRVMRAKHAGLARYIDRHVATGKRAWQRPLWRLALTFSRWVRTPAARARARRGS